MNHLVYVFDSGTANNELWLDGVLRLTFSMNASAKWNCRYWTF
jgi:hypothetical protein